MGQQTRMLKTLVVLAVSMTVTTVLLSRLEPGASRALPYPFPDQIRQQVRDAVTSAKPLLPDSWNGVEIALEHEVVACRDATLMAVAGEHNYHFRIGDTGKVTSSWAWHKQEPASAGGVIRVVLTDRRAGSAVPPLQWVALRMLLVELEGLLEPQVMPETTGRRISLSDHAAADHVLQAHLRSAGWLG
ncbi:MAG: hypothetical protein KAV82_01830 [Phycisphaerae bacterium]|nr:hypothetical protein [Phycisphaerae bacterium]